MDIVCEQHITNQNSAADFLSPTSYWAGWREGDGGNRRSGSDSARGCRALCVPGSSGDVQQRAPVTLSSNRKGSLGQEGFFVCSCVCVHLFCPDRRNLLFVLWNKEQAWLDWAEGWGWGWFLTGFLLVKTNSRSSIWPVFSCCRWGIEERHTHTHA